MGSRTSKPKTTVFDQNPNPFNYFSTIDPDSVMTGQPFIQPSDQKKPSVPLLDEDESQMCVNLLDLPPHLRAFYSSLAPARFNPFLFSPLKQTILTPILPLRCEAPLPLASSILTSPLISPPLAMPNISLNPQALLQPIYNKLFNNLRSNLVLNSFTQPSLPVPFTTSLVDPSFIQSKFAFSQQLPLMNSFTFQPFNQFNFLPPQLTFYDLHSL